MAEEGNISRSLVAIVGVSKPDVLEPKINEVFGEPNVFKLTNDQFLVASPSTWTTKEISDKLGVTSSVPISNAVILAVSGYFGRASVALWEWIPAKTGATR